MTVDLHPGRDYDAAMHELAAEMRRNTHLIVATGPYGEVLTQHARPHAEAVEFAGAWARTLGDAWTVRTVPVWKAAR
jgi:hypothetical protein